MNKFMLVVNTATLREEIYYSSSKPYIYA